MPLVHRVAIVSEKGEVKGFLRVAVQAISGKRWWRWLKGLGSRYSFIGIPIGKQVILIKEEQKNRLLVYPNGQ